MKHQKAFFDITEKVGNLKQTMLAQATELDNQFQAVMQKAFEGAF
jgi:hypothetical protein